jgi:beta-glucosidase
MTNQDVVVDVGHEGTPIGNAVQLRNQALDVLDVTRHYEQYEDDFDLQKKSLGISNSRYSITWGKVYVNEEQQDFSFYKPILQAMKDRGIVPTIDLCHHRTAHQIPGSYTNPDFPEMLMRYAINAKNEFPWVKRFVLINEPAVTSFLHANGTWGQYEWSRVFLNMAKAIVLTSHALLAMDPEVEFFSPEPIDHDVVSDSQDREMVEKVEFLTNWGRFGMDDLLSGRVNEHHGFYHHLIENGATPDELEWFQSNRAVAYNRDLDFYLHNLKEWVRVDGKLTSRINPNPPTLAQVICEYRKRMPEMRFGIAETNLRGTIRDRITWFRWVLEQCRKAGIRRLTWWGLTDADTWGDGNFTNRINDGTNPPDPVGIFALKDDPKHGRLWKREANEFSDIVASYAKGEISIEDIPAYKFTGEFKAELQGYVKHMHHMALRPATTKSMSVSR